MKSTREIILIALLVPTLLWAQEEADSVKNLEDVTVKGSRLSDVDRLPTIRDTYIMAGKKNEVVHLDAVNANITEKTARQIFAKIPGVFVYDMDGSGNQVNISTRGLDPHRGWEFNIRRNGAITNSDMYGYPASHYSMPMEAVDQIQLVRGTGSLQYGAQFGGMLNYITKRADTTRALQFESVNTVGSFGLISTYNAIGGKIGKVEYYAYYNKRVSEGYRKNGRTDSDAQSVSIIYRPTKNIGLRFEFSRSYYQYQLPGQLTDDMFHADPRQSTRARNYYSPDIYVPSIDLNWKIGKNTKLTWLTSAVLGNRSSVMFDKPANVVDAIDPITLQYAPRQVDIDNYNSYTSELRLLHGYKFLNQNSALVAGVQLMKNNMHRRQQGKGTTGTDYDLTLTEPGWGRDIHFKTDNIAFFMENRFALTKRLSLSPGLRAEMGKSNLDGSIAYYPDEELPNKIDHQFVLGGLNLQYNLRGNQNLYAGWAQAYRPVILKEIVPSSVYEKVDKNLKDARGYNFEAGYRGSLNALSWDLSGFYLVYNNRLGILSEIDINGDFYLYRTNIGNSTTTGAEIFVQYRVPFQGGSILFFTSTAFMDARYHNAMVRVNDSNVSVDGNKVESVPNVISRNGMNVKYRGLSVSFLYSYTADSYADALNTETPSANGSVGKVPSYGLLDVNAMWQVSDNVTIRLNMNNITNEQYFTKRPQFYPGPGIWPSDGRSVNVSFGLRI